MKLFLTITAILLFIGNSCFAQKSSYVGMEDREIKALSGEQIKGYLAGHGMGMALPAELNNYPGPKHVLEFSDSLKISDQQKKRIQTIFDEMHEESVKLGKSVVEKEKELDQLFATGRITDNSLASMISEICDLNGKLRFAHLSAHLKTVKVLDPSQIEKYNQLRGYGEDSMQHQHQHNAHVKD